MRLRRGASADVAWDLFAVEADAALVDAALRFVAGGAADAEVEVIGGVSDAIAVSTVRLGGKRGNPLTMSDRGGLAD